MKKYPSRRFQTLLLSSPPSTFDQVKLVNIFGYQSACSFVSETYIASTGSDRSLLYDYQRQGHFPPPYPYQTSETLGPIYRIKDLKYSKDSSTPFHIYPLQNNTQQHLPDQSQVTFNFLKRYFNQPTVLYDSINEKDIVIDVPLNIWKVKTLQNRFVTVSFMKTFDFSKKQFVFRSDQNDISELYNNISFVDPNGSFYPFQIFIDRECSDLFIDRNIYISKNILLEIRDQLKSQITNSQLATSNGVQILNF